MLVNDNAVNQTLACRLSAKLFGYILNKVERPSVYSTTTCVIRARGRGNSELFFTFQNTRNLLYRGVYN